jgi:undecaprenyl phosphate-alpha-L-ara4FN deformylase
MGRERVLGLKVDVDTRRGMEEGLPALLSLFAEFGVRATFFLSFGPDNSGKAVFQMVRNPRFLFKMIRTNAPGLYGFRTALYGTVLKAPMIASAFPDICRQIEERGHEVEFHAWGFPPTHPASDILRVPSGLRGGCSRLRRWKRSRAGSGSI